MIKKYTILLFAFFYVSLVWSQDYEQDVLPIFQVNCAGCHGISSGVATAGLNLSTEEDVLSNVDIVVPGDYENSILYQRIIGDGGYMPPISSMLLSGDEVNTVVEWISGLGGSDDCTDENACNYGEPSNCEYETCTGCTDPVACNYNACFDLDGNIIDCTIPGICEYETCVGCMD